MDPKASAKSKRSHSQRHSKKSSHPNQTQKTVSAGIDEASNKKPTSRTQAGDKINQSKSKSSLPSNWDRYDEEFDLGSKDLSGEGNNPANAGVVLPKSNGADYSYLISEAQSQSYSRPCLDPFASFADVFPDFNQAVGYIMSSRGQSILSHIEDDNFIVDDSAHPKPEAAFLSLNLNTLAEQLSKVDLSQRLFIEPELLLTELPDETSECVSKEVASSKTDEFGLDDFSKEANSTTQNSDLVNLTLRQGVESPQTEALELEEQFRDESVKHFNNNPSVFEGTSAEAELDMLLDSFKASKEENPIEEFSSSGQISSLQLHQSERPTLPSSVNVKVLDDFESWLDTI